MDHREMLRAVACIIAVDKKNSDERKLWKALYENLKIPEKEATEIYNQARKAGEYSVIPEDIGGKFELMTLLIQSAYIDNEISAGERQIISNIAHKIGMTDGDVDRIINVSNIPSSLAAKKEKRKSSTTIIATVTIIAAVIGALGTILATMLPMFLSDKEDAPLISKPVLSPAGAVVSTMFVKSITVSETRADGKKWDMTGKPDIQIEIQNLTSGQKFVTETHNDTVTALINTQVFRVTKNDNLQITVYDVDTPGNDIIGKLNQSITEEMLSQKINTWNFDQVTSFEVEFQPNAN